MAVVVIKPQKAHWGIRGRTASRKAYYGHNSRRGYSIRNITIKQLKKNHPTLKNPRKEVIFTIILCSFSELKAQINLSVGSWYSTDIDNVGFSINGKYDFNEKWTNSNKAKSKHSV